VSKLASEVVTIESLELIAILLSLLFVFVSLLSSRFAPPSSLICSTSQWTISCGTGDAFEDKCRFEATQSGGCATFTAFDLPMNLTDCSPIDIGDLSNPQNNPQQFLFTTHGN